MLLRMHKIRREKKIPNKVCSISPQITRPALYHKTAKARVPQDFFTNYLACNLVLIKEPENLDPMPRIIFLLEPRIPSPYELGLICLSLLWLEEMVTIRSELRKQLQGPLFCTAFPHNTLYQWPNSKTCFR